MLYILITLVLFLRALKKQLENEEFQTLLFLVIMILLLGTFFYHNVEGWGWLDSLYFSVITLTTIGYGDFSPKTDLGKAFTMIYVFAGLGILYGFATILGKEIVTHRLEKVGKTKQDNEDSEE
ncbi:two pore domain potassium channel family protein [Methanosarcina sp. KYL-1]|nr:two pore domain potassium channel family protein [Methanosarcina sp. KYL-1]